MFYFPQIDFFAGTFLSPTKEEMTKGFVGYSMDVLKANAWPDYREENGKQMGFFRYGPNKDKTLLGDPSACRERFCVFTFITCFMNQSAEIPTAKARLATLKNITLQVDAPLSTGWPICFGEEIW